MTAQYNGALSRITTFLAHLHGDGPAGVAVFDSALRCTYWNATMSLLSGIPSAAAQHRLHTEVLLALLATVEQAQLVAALDGKLTTSERDDGTRVFYAPLRAEGSEGIVGVVLIVRTANDVAAARLAEVERRFQTMADCAPVLLWMSGTDALCWFFNETWLRFRGRTLEEEQGVGWAEGVHPEDFQACMDTYYEAFCARRPFEMVYRLARADGAYRWILDRGTPRYTAAGEFTGFIGSCVDITERTEVEADLRQTAARLAQSNAELERFAYAASHDLREPLRVVSLYATRLLDKAATLDSDSRRWLGHVVDGAQRMDGLINGILSISQLQKADRSTMCSVDTKAVVREALANLTLAVREARAEIETGDLPPVMGLFGQLLPLFQNLLSNALKFRAAGPPHVFVGARVADANVLEFEVRDNGIGVSPEHIDSLFVMFKKLHPRDRFPGSGIGLALCRQIVELHGGRIWMESEPGVGTTLRFTLPAA